MSEHTIWEYEQSEMEDAISNPYWEDPITEIHEYE